MKNHLLFAALAILLAGCHNEDEGGRKIWDFYNPDVVFVVTNDAGSNLLDPAVDVNILDRPIRVVYKNKTYLMNGDPDGKTRETIAYWNGLRVEPLHPTADHTPVLKFGEFKADGDYRGETFTVDWGDGTMTEVKFDLYVVYSDKYLTDATIYRKLWIDGKQVSDDSLTAKIVK